MVRSRALVPSISIVVIDNIKILKNEYRDIIRLD